MAARIFLNGMPTDRDPDQSRIVDHLGRPWQQETDDTFALPHVYTFGGLIGQSYRVYWHQYFDEARKHSREDAIIMENDAGLQGMMQERKLAVASLPWHLEVPDDKDPVQVKCRDALRAQVENIPTFRQLIYCLLDAIWHGRHGAQVRWKWVQEQGQRVLTLRDWRPVRGDKIGHTWSGTPYVLVWPAVKDLPGAEFRYTTVGGKGLILNGAWRERFLIHRHELVDADFLDIAGSEAIHGVGVRSRIFWLDWLKREWLSNITEYMQRVGLGVELWYYDPSNNKSRTETLRAAKEAEGTRTRLLVPRWGDDRQPGLERIEVPMSGAEFLLKLYSHVEELQRLYITGQLVTAGQKKTGSGIGNEADAEAQTETKDQIRNYDARNLAEVALTGSEDWPGLLYLMQSWSFPETIPSDQNPGGFWVKFRFSLEHQKSQEQLQAIAQVVSLGLPVKIDEVYSVAGLTRPDPDDDVLQGPSLEEQQAPPPGQNGDGDKGGGKGNGWQPVHGPRGGHHLQGPDGQMTPMKGGRKTPFERGGALARFVKDAQGGEEPAPDIDRTSLALADFITYPEGVQGSNCGNCRYNEKDVCQYEGPGISLKGQPVNARNCCGKWDAAGTLRDWEGGKPRRYGYNSNEPRIPAGSPEGGEWTTGGGGSSPMNARTIPAPPAGSKPIADAAKFGGETRFRMSSVGAALPTGWSYGEASSEDELQEGFQVWDDLAQFAHAAAEESDDGDYSLNAGYDMMLLVNASQRKRHAGGNFWSAVKPEDVNHVWAIPTEDFVNWLKSASGTWDESEGRFFGLRKWARANEDAISGWMDAHARPVEAQAEETIEDEDEG